ncbi:MAG: hypothetical protein IPL32_04690 [Chloracidobacterium sp.]|nr:hypothetical protein [Chloracidobacterium sp.]
MFIFTWSENSDALSITGIVFFGGAALLFLWQAIDRRSRITIDHLGIYYRTLRIKYRIDWSDIIGTKILSVSGLKIIRIKVKNRDKYLKRMNVKTNKIPRSKKLKGIDELDLSLGLGLIDAKPEAVYDIVKKNLVNHSK